MVEHLPSMGEALGSISQHHKTTQTFLSKDIMKKVKQGAVVSFCNPSSQEAQAGESRVGGQPWATE
jgi:hypothetical protein